MDGDMHRRSTDDTVEHQKEIEELIAQEEDKKSRITLLVLSRMNSLLIENTKSTKNVVEEVEKLAEKVDQIVLKQNGIDNQRKGAMFVVRWVVPILQAAMIGAITLIANDLKNIHTAQLQIISEQARREPIIADLREFKRRFETEMDKGKRP